VSNCAVTIDGRTKEFKLITAKPINNIHIE